MNTPNPPLPICCLRRFATTSLLTCIAVLLLSIPPQVRAANEYQLKAVWLYNIAQFGRWADSAFPDPRAPFTIGILGDDEIYDSLDSAVNRENIRGRKFAIKRGRTVGALKGCQIIFISKSETSRLAEILSALSGQGILTVGESAAFCAQGGAFNLTLSGGNIAVEVSLDALKREGIKMGSSLLQQCKKK